MTERRVDPRRLERAGVLVLLAAAFLMRARSAAAELDREFDGHQGALFAIAAVNYERLGFARFRGFPAFVVDLPPGAEAEPIAPADAFVYANHPPLVPWLAWSSLALLAPRGWSEAWRDARAPEGIELALRAPFLVLHLFALWCFHRLVRSAAGAGTALIALGILAMLPVTILYGSLVNYENPALPCVLLAVLAYVACARRASAPSPRGGARPLAALAGALFAGTSVTWGSAFFLPAMIAHAACTRRLALAARVALAGGAAVAAAALAHAALARGLGGGIVERARELLAPLASGDPPLARWLAVQARELVRAAGAPVVIVAALGLFAHVARAISPAARARLARLEVAPPADRVGAAGVLALGALIYFLAFYRHTAEAQHTFQLLAAPAVAFYAASAVALLGRPLLALRAGFAPHVLVVASLLLPGLWQEMERERALRAPGPRDDPPSADGPELPLPRSLARAIAPLVPRGTVALMPASLGTTPALAFYAWRNAVPAASASGALPPPYSGSRFLAGAPRVLVLPDAPPEGARAEVELLREAMRASSASASSANGWTAYALR